MKIITNNVPRDIQDDEDDTGYFIYKGHRYNLDEFLHTTDPQFKEWDGILADTYFSATLMKYANDWQSVIVGRAYA